MHASADKLMDKLGISKASKKRNKVHKGICGLTGHPVDVATGKVLTSRVDVELPAERPIAWERIWYSTSGYRGPLGHGWHHSFDLGLLADEHAVAIRLADGRGAAFAALAVGEQHTLLLERLVLARDEQGYVLSTADGSKIRFAGVGRRSGEQAPVQITRPDAQIQLSYDAVGRLLRIDSEPGADARASILIRYDDEGPGGGAVRGRRMAP